MTRRLAGLPLALALAFVAAFVVVPLLAMFGATLWVDGRQIHVVRASGPIEPLTIDHSLLEEYRRTRPDLSDEQLKKFPYKNVITRALGMKSDVSVEMHRHEMHSGDTLVLCCDGLTGMLSDENIARIIRANPNLNDACRALVQAANDNGGVDNITVVLVRTF